MRQGSVMDVTTTQGTNPELLVTLSVKPPIKNPGAEHDTRLPWSLDMLERTCIELRAAGAWDESKVTLLYQELKCEILTTRAGSAVMPWGYRPSTDPEPTPLRDRRLDSLPWWRVTEIALLIAILVCVVFK